MIHLLNMGGDMSSWWDRLFLGVFYWGCFIASVVLILLACLVLLEVFIRYV